MKTRFIRIAASVSALLMAATLLAGCADDTGESGQSSESSNSGQASATQNSSEP